MIPVYYDATSATEGVWRIADSNNLNETYKWFDYKNFMWANAVTVNKNVMGNYTNYSGPETTSQLSVNIATNEEKTVLEQLKNVTFSSTNQSVASSSSIFKLTFHTTSSGTLSFNYTLGSESNYDKLTITINNGSTTTTLVSAVSGSISSTPVSTSLVSGKDYTLTATYSKDSSMDKNGDTATITDLTITSTLSADPVKDTSSTYPWSGDIPTYISPNKQMASSSYTYNESTGVFTLTNPTSIAYTSSNINYYTCNSSTGTSCLKLYKILDLDTNNTVTNVEVHQASNKNFGSALGQEVKMEDITTMWVWIPRFKYKIFNGNNETSEEQLIKVEFEEGTNTTGTVTCVDNILTSDTSSSSETCTDATNGSIINGKSTYTHPAFTFGDTELTGFWMAKFEVSTDDENCLNNQTADDCNKTGLNIFSKPGEVSLRYITISKVFANIRRMEVYGNIHGFSQSASATTWLNSSTQLTGEIANDNNNFDIHMIKNMEWGAVAYLSQSQYGKSGNDLYTGIYKEIYTNNYYDKQSIEITKTGYSGGSFDSSYSTTETYLYNDMTELGSGKGYRGAGASTTGTIYGVYDMSGGALEEVMANGGNSSGYFLPSYAETWSTAATGNIPNPKYYDKYSYSSQNYYGNPSILRSKLGDGTKETMVDLTSRTGWNSDDHYMPYSTNSWICRGGDVYFEEYSGVFESTFSSGGSGHLNSSRAILVVMP